MPTIIKLSFTDNILTGKYSPNDKDIIVELDSSIGAFTVTLPDLISCGDRVFMFKNYGTNTVTLQTVHGQIIDYAGIQTYSISYKTALTIVSNNLNKWITIEDNSGIIPTPVIIGSATNGIQIASDGNIKLLGTAMSWIDEIGDVIKLQQQGTGVSSNAIENSVEFVTAANLNDYLYFNVQLNHNRYLASAINFHIHFWQANNNMPNFLLKYRYQANGSGKTTAWTNLKCNTPAYTYVSGTLNQIAFSASINPVNAGLSDIIQLQVFRDNANTSGVFTGADPYTGTVGITSIDCHFQVDGFGSNDEYTK